MVPLNVRLRASELADVLDAVRPVALIYDVDGEGRRDLDARLEEARGTRGDHHGMSPRPFSRRSCTAAATKSSNDGGSSSS